MTLGELRKIIREEALTPSESMALAEVHSGMQGDRVYVLYDPSQINVSVAGKDLDEVPASAVLAYIERDVSGEIHAPVAVKGYGPIIYEIAMVTSANGIFSDRAGRTDSALRVWRRFMDRGDIEKQLLEPELRSNDDPMEPTNYRFMKHSTSSVDLHTLRANHARVMRLRAEIGDSRFDHRLWGVGYAFFKARMK